MKSYVAVDQFEFQAHPYEECEISPKEAKPPEPPTTQPPTEPPDSKQFSVNSKKIVKIIYFLDAIICDFEKDKCNFELNSVDSKGNYQWTRTTPEELQNNGIIGPDLDYNGHTNGHFMIATDAGKGRDEVAVAEMRSPIFNSTQHPKECFHFWFYFEIEDKDEALAVFLENESQEKVKDLWLLRGGWSDVSGWDEGTVEFQIENPAEELKYRVSSILYFLLTTDLTHFNVTPNVSLPSPFFLHRLLLLPLLAKEKPVTLQWISLNSS